MLVAAAVLVHLVSPNAGAAACGSLPPSLPAPGSLPAISELPDPFKSWDGTRLTNASEWAT
ncbi:hypothetical protein [Nonomuraea jabiensis]|uniref:hypothetical protein n=1 Tax=Nonomuraea jabiensis TaxID=882448 RepID=UPI003D7101A0